MQNILYRLVECQTHFGMPRGAKLSWPSINQNKLLFIQIQTLSPSMHHKWKEIINLFSNQRKIISGPTPNESPIELKDNSIKGLKCSKVSVIGASTRLNSTWLPAS